MYKTCTYFYHSHHFVVCLIAKQYGNDKGESVLIHSNAVSRSHKYISKSGNVCRCVYLFRSCFVSIITELFVAQALAAFGCESSLANHVLLQGTCASMPVCLVLEWDHSSTASCWFKLHFWMTLLPFWYFDVTFAGGNFVILSIHTAWKAKSRGLMAYWVTSCFPLLNYHYFIFNVMFHKKKCNLLKMT